MNDRYARLVRGGLRAIGRIGNWTGIVILIAAGAVASVLASLAIEGMGLALMGTDIGIGPAGCIGIMVVVGLAIYGSVCLLRRR